MKKKILIITTQFPPDLGGISTACHRLANELKDRGHQVVVIAKTKLPIKPEGDYEPLHSTELGFSVYSFHKKIISASSIMLLPRILDIAEKFNPDVVHSYYLHPMGYLGKVVADHVNAIALTSARGADVTNNISLRPGFISTTVESSCISLSVSRSLSQWAKFLNKNYEIKEVYNSVLPNFKFCKEGKETWRTRHNVQADDVIIGFNAVFRWKKNPDYLFRLVEMLSKSKTKNIVFLLMGNYNDEFRNNMCEITDSNNIRLIEARDPLRKEMPIIYSAMDIYVLTSLFEGMPNSVLEAMACRTAIATTPANGCRDLIDAGDFSLELHPYEPVHSLDNFEALIKDKKRIKSMGIEAEQVLLRDFSIDKEVNGYINYYNEALN